MDVMFTAPAAASHSIKRDSHPSNPHSVMGYHYLVIYKRYLYPSKAIHSASLVKVKAGSDTMIHTPQLKDSLHLN